jgi:WD40 repeat protein
VGERRCERGDLLPDNARVAAGGSKGIRVWDAATGKLLKEIPSDAAVLALAYSPDGKTLAAGAFDQNVHLWDTATWKEALLKGHESEVRAIAYSLDGKLLVTGGVGEARVWDAKTRRHLRSLKHQGTVWAVTFSPSGKVLATGSGAPAEGEGEARTWNLSDWSTEGRWVTKGGAVVSVAFSPNEKMLAGGRYDGGVVVWHRAGAER